MVLTHWLFPQKSSTADVRLDSKCASDWRYCKCEMEVDCKCTEAVVAGWCTVNQLRLDQTIRNLTCGDLEIPLVMIRLEVIGLKKNRFVYLLDLFGGREGEGVVWVTMCGVPLIGLMLVIMVLVLWEFKDKIMLY